METHKQMEEIVLSGSEEESGTGTMISAETVLDSNAESDWTIQYTGLMKKLEDRFNKEVYIPVAKQPPTVKDNNSATTQTVTSGLGERVFSRVDHSVEFPSTYEVKELDIPHNPTITVAMKNWT